MYQETEIENLKQNINSRNSLKKVTEVNQNLYEQVRRLTLHSKNLEKLLEEKPPVSKSEIQSNQKMVPEFELEQQRNVYQEQLKQYEQQLQDKDQELRDLCSEFEALTQRLSFKASKHLPK